MSLVDQLGLNYPIVQAGMGGGIAAGRLAGAVSAAGGLGTVGIMAAGAMGVELRRARDRAGRAPVAANLLIPFVTREHVDVCRSARTEAVVLHGGFNAELIHQCKRTGALVLDTVGTAAEARRSIAGGADALIVQGREAGGHLVGVEPALTALARVRDAVGTTPLLLAGGIADATDVARALEHGASAVVVGTRFLLTDESGAHPQYQRAVLAAERTLETELFSLGWPMRHRVIPNAATERWCRRDERGPRLIRALERLSSPMSRLPPAVVRETLLRQRVSIPLYGPSAPVRGMPDGLVDATPLYAGESALRISSVVSAEEAVLSLAGAERKAVRQSPTIPSS